MDAELINILSESEKNKHVEDVFELIKKIIFSAKETIEKNGGSIRGDEWPLLLITLRDFVSSSTIVAFSSITKDIASGEDEEPVETKEEEPKPKFGLIEGGGKNKKKKPPQLKLLDGDEDGDI